MNNNSYNNDNDETETTQNSTQPSISSDEFINAETLVETNCEEESCDFGTAETLIQDNSKPRNLTDLATISLKQSPNNSSSQKSSVSELLISHSENDSKYIGENEIARGGMGAILHTVDKNLRREVAMKVMLNSNGEEEQIRFLEEAQITGQLEHPNIVPVHELALDAKNRPYFTMKLVKGKSLAEIINILKNSNEENKEHLIQYNDKWSLPRLLQALVQVCHAIEFAHVHGVVHRDIKPANIMLGSFGEVLVMDWGLAKLGAATGEKDEEHKNTKIIENLYSQEDESGSGMTMEGSVLGTPAYMPPEQAMGKLKEIDERSDVYSLGAVLYTILSHNIPITGKNMKDVLSNVKTGKITPLSKDFPPELTAITMKAMATKQEDRYQKTTDLRKDIELYIDGRSVSAHQDSVWTLFIKLIKRNKGVSASIAITTIILIIITTLFISSLKAERQEAIIARNEAESAKNATAKTNVKLKWTIYTGNIHDAQSYINDNNKPKALQILTSDDTCPSEHRGIEWGRLMRLCRQETMIFKGHTESIVSCAFSPNDKYIISGGKDNIVRVWKTSTGKQLLALKGHTSYITSVSFSPDGTKILSGSEDGTARIWDAKNGDCLEVLRGHYGTPLSKVDWSPNGKWVATAPGSKYDTTKTANSDGTIKLWDTKRWRIKKICDFDGINNEIADICFSPDSSLLLAKDTKDLLKIWDINSTYCIDSYPLKNVSIAPSLYIGGPKTIVIDDLQNKAFNLWNKKELEKDLVKRWSNDNKFYASTSVNKTIIYSANEKKEFSLDGYQSSEAYSFSNDSKMFLIAGGDKKLHLWLLDKSLQSEVLLKHGENGGSVCAISPDESLLATGGNTGNVKIWDTKTFKEIDSYQYSKKISIKKLSFSEDSKSLAVGMMSGVKIIDLINKTSHELKENELYNDYKNVMFINNDKDLLFTRNRQLNTYNFKENKEFSCVDKGAKDTISALAHSKKYNKTITAEKLGERIHI